VVGDLMDLPFGLKPDEVLQFLVERRLDDLAPKLGEFLSLF
jgi:hypothetical protein